MASLSLRSAELRSSDLERLCCSLDPTLLLTALDVGGNYLGSAGASVLASFLGSRPALATLSVSDNQLLSRSLSDKGQPFDGESADAAGLTELLAASSGLQFLDLSYNQCVRPNPSGGKVALTIHSRSLGDEGAEALARFFLCTDRGALSLMLGYNKLTPHGVGRLAASLRRPAGETHALRALDLRNNTLRVEGAAALATALKPDESGASLAVAALGVMNNYLTAVGGALIAAALVGNTFVESLDVSSNCLGADGVAAMASLLSSESPLRELLLHRNNAGDDGAAALAAALPTSQLVSLRLSSNHVKARGCFALAESLRSCATLARVDLRRNPFNDADAETLRAAAMPSVELILGDGPV
jgi:Ran GTPase-activating protein (RanGAP) involved in mRNA processing and transport